MSETPGWDSIDAHLRRLLGDARPAESLGTTIRWQDGGPDPLDHIRTYDGGDHWHYVGFGLSELDQKITLNPAESGWGIELTMRVAKAGGDARAQRWPVERLNQLARYVFESRHRLLPGDFLDTNGPVTATTPNSAIRALLFTLDPVLGELVGSNGRVRFVQVVGVTLDELAAAQDWGTEALLTLFTRVSPKLVTDVARRSWLETHPALAAEARAGAERDGSSHGASFTKQLRIDASARGTVIEIGAIAIPDLRRGLRLRVPFGEPFSLFGQENRAVHLVPAAESRWNGATQQLALTAADARALAEALPQRRGEHANAVVRGVAFRVVPTEIRGSRGELVDTIG